MLAFSHRSRLFAVRFAQPVLLAALLGIGLFCSSNIAHAQPVSGNAGKVAPTPQWLIFAQGRFTDVAQNNPTAAVALGRQYLQANPTLSPLERIRLYSEMGRQLYQVGPDNNRAATAKLALQLLDEGIFEVQSKQEARYARELVRTPHFAQMEILVGEGRLSEAENLLHADFGSALWSVEDESMTWYALGVSKALYTKQGLLRERVGALQEALDTRLLQRQLVENTLFKLLVSELLASGRKAEALSYAKLNFDLCACEGNELQAASELLGQVWTALGQPESVSAFNLAQREASAPNPLADVPLPALSALIIEAQLPRLKATAIKSRNSPLRFGGYITVLLAQGQYGAAMEVAKRLQEANAGTNVGQGEICRVFKAVDHDVVRAVRYAGLGEQGRADLLSEFEAQFPPPEVSAMTPAPIADGSGTTPPPTPLSAERLKALKLDLESRLLERRPVQMEQFALVITSLLNAKQNAEALSYARLAFEFGPTREKELLQVTQLLTQAWLAQNGINKLIAFTKAQKEVGAPNPLREVGLPSVPVAALDTALSQAQEAVTKSDGNRSRLGDLVTVQLVKGDYRGAMTAAQQLWQSEKGVGAAQASRVFKAADSNLLRANRFLAISEESEQATMMQQFLSEPVVSSSATTATVGGAQ